MHEIIIYDADGTAAAPEDHAEFTYTQLETDGYAWIEKILGDPYGFTVTEYTGGMSAFRRILDRQDRQGEFRVTDVFDMKWIIEVVEH